ncbi:hypothetical protein CCHR01_19713 [Colletotrichum chrysophilum]|uniref:Uncharacterized protein n=1 Tax=Colletotrichum chrysophilum TaxID=1836956 RepID=A0AAD8ZY41_9PEZI|nr:hypothetical protein CCHR01_19713 [Colletotrichum chrysophilum]
MGYVVGGGLIRRSDFLPTGSTAQNQRSPPTTKPPDLIAYITRDGLAKHRQYSLVCFHFPLFGPWKKIVLFSCNSHTGTHRITLSWRMVYRSRSSTSSESEVTPRFVQCLLRYRVKKKTSCMQWRYIWIMFDFFGWPWAAICLFARMKKNGTHMERCSALRCRSKRRGHPPAGFFLAFFSGSYFSLLCYAALFGRLAIGTLFSFQTERETETPQNLRCPLFTTFLDVSYSYFLFVSIWHSLESVMATGYELSEGWQIMRARSSLHV